MSISISSSLNSSLKDKGFDLIECKTFLDNIEEVVTVDAVFSLLQNTIYISHSKFKKSIQSNINNFLIFKQKGRPIFAYLDTHHDNYSQKSNYWVYQMIKDCSKFKSGNIDLIYINSLNDDRIIDHDVVLLADDCIYSGKQMADTFQLMKNSQNKHVNIFLYVPFISHSGLNRVMKAYEENSDINACTFHTMENIEYIKPLSSFLNEDQIKELAYYYPHLSKNIISSAYPIYFEHKVAKFVSSFPAIYSGIIPNEYNREIIKQISKLEDKLELYDFFKLAINSGQPIPDYDNIEVLNMDINNAKNQIKRLQKTIEVIPFLKMCVSVKPAIADLYESSCPVPEYKTKARISVLESIVTPASNSASSSKRSNSSDYINKKTK